MKPISVQHNKANAITTQLLIATLLVAGITTYVSLNNVSTRFKAGSEEQEISLFFVPNNQPAKVGTTITLSPFVTAKAKKPGFMLFSLTYDATKLTYTGSDDTKVTDTIELILPPEDTTNTTQPAMHTLRLTYAVKDPVIPPGETIQLSNLSFVVNDTAATSIHVDTAKSQVVFLDSVEGIILANDAMVNVPAN